jgi:hypothetical protein
LYSHVVVEHDVAVVERASRLGPHLHHAEFREPGFVNTVKAGSAVPLTFNVTVNGIVMKDPAELAIQVTENNCSPGAPEDAIDSR